MQCDLLSQAPAAMISPQWWTVTWEILSSLSCFCWGIYFSFSFCLLLVLSGGTGMRRSKDNFAQSVLFFHSDMSSETEQSSSLGLCVRCLYPMRVFCCYCFWTRSRSPGWTRTTWRLGWSQDAPVPASQVLRLQGCVTMSGSWQTISSQQ